MASTFQILGLKTAVGLTALMPITNGLLGIVKGSSMLETRVQCSLPLDSHFRYLSGLPLGMGVLLLRSLPTVEHDGTDLRRVTLLIFIGGLGRLWGLMTAGYDKNSILLTAAELLVLPAICTYQNYVEKKTSRRH